MTNLSLTYSFWWVLICLLVGLIYAWIQYAKTAPWSKEINYFLAGLRTMLVAVICFFFLEPFMQSIINYYQKPLMVIAVDNSESMKLTASVEELVDLNSKIKGVNQALLTRGFDVNIIGLDGKLVDDIDSLKYINSGTNLSTQLNTIKKNYGNFNLSGVVLFSDGIFNEGYSPLALSTSYPIYAVGVGDTSKIRDLAIKEIRHNSTVFEGNDLLLEVQVLNKGVDVNSTQLIVSQKGKLISTEKIVMDDNQRLIKSILSIPISGSGKQSLTVKLNPVEGEYTDINNTQTIYFDVIDARKKVLLIAAAPHPDLKAIKSSIEKSEYYQVELAFEMPKDLDFDLIIAHQYPAIRSKSVDKASFKSSKIPKLMIVGLASDFRFLKTDLALFNSPNVVSKIDLVKPVINNGFDKFNLSDSFLEWVSDLPPIAVPYGLAINKGSVDEFLTQQIGSVSTKQPLLYFTNFQEQRMGVLLGTNIWKWRLDEFRLNQTHENFDDLISKIVQYLGANVNKKRFYVNSQKAFYEEGDEAAFSTEEYNSVFERVVGNQVSLTITDENSAKTSYSYVPLSQNSIYKVNGLTEGVYSYYAATEIDKKKYYSSGQFVVRKLNKEALNPVADFDLLKKVAYKSNASFVDIGQTNELITQIGDLNPVSSIHTTEKDEPLINIKWMMIFLLLLATSEWFLRKFYGGY